MNAIFTVIFTISVIILTFLQPEKALSSMINGANKSITLSLSLLSIYAVWGGILEIASDSGIIDGISKLLKPIIRKLFKTNDKNLEGIIAINLSANLLGMGGIATPSGITATTLMTNDGNHYGASLLFIISATSIQLLPTTVISLRQSYNSLSPYDVILPCLFTTVFSSLVGVITFMLSERFKVKK